MYGVNPVAHFWVVLHHIDGGERQTPAVSVALEIQGQKDGSGTCCMFAGVLSTILSDSGTQTPNGLHKLYGITQIFS